ncbi:MAG: acyl-CoA/acyl-ACP dehydrogenase, partial [Anaerolineae bacterium]|nr:acyl-CoA/acyl-ACP dehydrogenase [Anaerolineae bacterium]
MSDYLILWSGSDVLNSIENSYFRNLKMDFSLPDHIQAMARRVQQFVEREVIPLEPYVDDHEDGITPEALKAVRAKARIEGVWAPQLPISLGGQGLTLEEIVPVFEAAGRS